jgi:hypothetical protein
MMNEVKKLGRPKGNAKAKDAEWLFGERINAPAKRKLEELRLFYRCSFYQLKKHGATPTALPKVTNKTLLDCIIINAHHIIFGAHAADVRGMLMEMLRKKGCLNAAELLGIEEGPEQ